MLVAISIPIFTSQLEKSREATDLANLRSAYAAATAAYLDDDTFTGGYYNADMANVRSAYAALVTGYLADGSIGTATVSAQQTVDSWQTDNGGILEVISDGGTSGYAYSAVTKDGTYTVTISEDASTGNIIPDIS